MILVHDDQVIELLEEHQLVGSRSKSNSPQLISKVDSGGMSITFECAVIFFRPRLTEQLCFFGSCEPFCSCPWRILLDREGIYRLSQSVTDPDDISSAIESWLLRRPDVEKELGDWKEEDAVTLMAVIETVSQLPPPSPPWSLRLSSSQLRSYRSEQGRSLRRMWCGIIAGS